MKFTLTSQTVKYLGKSNESCVSSVYWKPKTIAEKLKWSK